MADTTTRLPIGIEEIDGNALATVTTSGALPVELKNGSGDELPTNLTQLSGNALATPTTPGVLVTGFDSAQNTVQISQTAGENGVDIVKIGGNAVASATTSGALLVGIDPSQNVVSLGAGGTNKSASGTVNVPKPVGSTIQSGTINFTDITTGTTGKLLQISLFSQTQMRVEINTDAGGTATLAAVSGTPAGGGAFTFKPASEDSITQAGGVGNNFQIVAYNLDKNKDADIYAFAEWVEV